MRDGHNQYAPMTGIPPLRNAITTKTQRVYGHRPDTDTEITVTSGATEAIFHAIHAVVRAGDEVIVLAPAYDCYEPEIDRKSVVEGTSVSVRVHIGGLSSMTQTTSHNKDR